MLGLILRRVVSFVPVLVLTSIVVFSLIHLAPGDPVDVIVGEDRPGPEVIAAIRHDMGFDQPLPVQYLVWAGHVLQGDLGYSYRSRQPVIQLVAARLPETVELAIMSTLLGLVVAFPLGLAAALNRNRWPDAAASLLSAVGASMPAFWLGILLIYAFALRFQWLPPSGFVSAGESLGDNLRSMALPVVTLSFGYAAVMMRFFRTSLLDNLAMDFVRTARAKGLGSQAVIGTHVLRNALIPILTVLGVETGRLLGGAVLTETIFALPGLGRLAVDSVLSRDFPTMQAAVMVMALAVLGSNLVVDVLYGVVDPRLRVQS